MPRRRSASLRVLFSWLLGAAVCAVKAVSASQLAPAEVFVGDDSSTLVWEARPSGDSRVLTSHNDTTSGANDLLTWAAQGDALRPPSHRVCTDCFLVVGVKTRAVRGFEARQSIRATWASRTATLDVPTRVVFLACEPDPLQERDMNATQHALAVEKQTYGDLLTHELGGCVDGYNRLADKVLGFFHWIQGSHSTAPFVMVADDDGYVRLDLITEMLNRPETPRSRYYAGQVLATQRRHAVPVIRDRTSKYYLSEEDYAMSTFVPFGIGAHYLLSSDLSAFLARNRHDLRPIGSLEDVSVGFWLLSLLQVHAVDIPLFRCTTRGLCRNSFVSYGELSRAAVEQIHANLEHGKAFCHGFSFASWGAPEIQEPPTARLPPRNDANYQWEFRVCPRTRALRIDTIVQLREPLLPLSLQTVQFTPSFETMSHFCNKLNDAAAQLQRRLPIMLCDDLVGRLRDALLAHPLSKTALLTLARSNLPPFAVLSASVTVWITRRVLRWRAFIESLMAGIYSDVHVFAVDDVSVPDPSVLVNLDFVVSSVSEYAQLHHLPSSCRPLIFTEPSQEVIQSQLQDPSKARDELDDKDEERGTILFTQDRLTGMLPPVPHAYQWMYVPLVSLVFSDSAQHSPVELLQASSERIPSFHPEEMLAVSHCTAHVLALISQLREPLCDSESSGIDANGSGDSSPETVFDFDTDVERYTRSRFVLAFEQNQERSGFIGGAIAAAFLAGSIPVYNGDETTVTRLFNPKAFISCRHFPSVEACGDYVMEVHRSPKLYAEMRSEPPVVNEAAFFDQFSWHPDVLRQSRFRTLKHESMVERLLEKINSV